MQCRPAVCYLQELIAYHPKKDGTSYDRLVGMRYTTNASCGCEVIGQGDCEMDASGCLAPAMADQLYRVSSLPGVMASLTKVGATKIRAILSRFAERSVPE